MIELSESEAECVQHLATGQQQQDNCRISELEAEPYSIMLPFSLEVLIVDLLSQKLEVYSGLQLISNEMLIIEFQNLGIMIK